MLMVRLATLVLRLCSALALSKSRQKAGRVEGLACHGSYSVVLRLMLKDDP